MRPVLETLESRLLLASQPFIEIGAEVEPNDTIETATPLPESPHQQLRPCFLDSATGIADCPPTLYAGRGSLASDDPSRTDVDFWSLRLAEGNVLRLVLEGDAAAGGVLPSLVGPDGSVLRTAEPHDRDGDGTVDFAVVEFVAEISDTIYIQVGPGPDTAAGSLGYSLNASVKHGANDHERNVEHEPNDTFETAQEIPLTWREHDVSAVPAASAAGLAFLPPREGHGFVRGSLENGTVSPDTDFYQILVGPELTIDVRAAGAGAQGGHLTVYDQEHNVIAKADPNAEGHLAATFESTYEGTYFIQLTDTGTVVCVTTPCLTYELRITARREFVDPYAEHEPNDTLDTANALHQVRPWIPMPLDELVHSEESTAAAVHPVPDVICLAIGCGYPAWWNRRAAFLVRGDFSTPTDGADTDYFSFPAKEDRNIVVSYNGLADGDIELLDADGDVLAQATSSPSDDDGDKPNHATIEFFTSVGGTFYVHLSHSADTEPASETNYNLHVTTTHEPNIEHEPNDTLETANEIDLRPRFPWPCESIVCPLADANGTAIDPADHSTPGEARAAELELRPMAWPEPRTLHGFIEGELEDATCPPDAVCVAVIQPGVDNFVFDVPAGQHLSIHLTGPLAEHGGVLKLLDADGAELASDADGSDGLDIEWRTIDGGTFYAQVTGAPPMAELSANDETPSVVTADNASTRNYRLGITAEPLSNPIEGHDEHEPNDTMDQANAVELPRVGDVVCLAIGCPPAPRPGEHSRHRVVNGIAGGPTHDVDYFSFQVLAGEQVSVGLGRERRYELESLTNIVDPEPAPQPLLFVTVFDSEGNEIGRTGDDSTKPVLFESELGGVYFARVELLPDAPDTEVADYVLRLHASKFSVEGPDETEPNDTFDEADPIELASLPTFAPGVEVRGGDARGIAGGPSHDQDVFSFEVQAGEHVTVGVTGFGRNLGDCPPGFAADGAACVGVHEPASPEPAERLPRFVYDRPIHVRVFDAEGNEVGASDGDAAHPHAVTFDAAASGEYFAVVSVSPDSDALVRYRLGVLARLTVEPQEVHFDEPPLEITLRHGQSFRYTDSDGDAVQIVFQGRGGTAHIMFDGSDANGSDIASVAVAGVRSGGNFRVRTNGSAEVGSLVIEGSPARARRPATFGNVSIDGNLGSLSSSLSLRSLAVDGILGELSAPGRQIRQVSAMVFDHAMADVGSIRSMRVEEEMSAALFDRFLPWEEQP